MEKSSYRIHGILKHPDFRQGRCPITGTEGYPVIYQARKKIQTLIHSRPVRPITPTRKADYEFAYGQHRIGKRTGNHKRRVTDIKKKSSDTALKERRFQYEQSRYLQSHNEYKREKNQLTNQIEREYAANLVKYKPFGRPGGGAPLESVRRTKKISEILGDDGNNVPFEGSQANHKFHNEPEIFRCRNRFDERRVPRVREGVQYLQELQKATKSRHESLKKLKNQPNGITDDFFAAFGKPGSGAPRKTKSGEVQTQRTQKFQSRFSNDQVSIGLDLGKGHGNPKFDGDNQPVNHKQKIAKPKKENMAKIGERINKETNNQQKNRDTQTAPHTGRETVKAVQSTKSEPEVTKIHTSEEVTANMKSEEPKIKGSGSNPIHIKLPRYSKERIPPWNKEDD